MTRPRARGAGRKIVVLCEGDSEEIAVKEFIRPKFATSGYREIGLRPINLYAKLEDVFVKTPRFAKDPGVCAVFTLIDLYGMNRVQHRPGTALDEKVASVIAWLRDGVSGVDAGFFHPHVAVHEIEAWFLADGAALAKRLRHQRLDPDPQAETKDFDRPPKTRVKEMFRKHLHREYSETRDGTPLFRELRHDQVYETCRYYREFYDDLCQVAKGVTSG